MVRNRWTRRARKLSSKKWPRVVPRLHIQEQQDLDKRALRDMDQKIVLQIIPSILENTGITFSDISTMVSNDPEMHQLVQTLFNLEKDYQGLSNLNNSFTSNLINNICEVRAAAENFQYNGEKIYNFKIMRSFIIMNLCCAVDKIMAAQGLARDALVEYQDWKMSGMAYNYSMDTFKKALETLKSAGSNVVEATSLQELLKELD